MGVALIERRSARIFDKFAHSAHIRSMLTYLGRGTRRYGEKPVRVYARRYWEFEAVLSGEIAPVFARPRKIDPRNPGYPGAEAETLRPRTLWVFPPGLEHGWTGGSGEDAEVAVFHFDTLPEPAATLVRRRTCIAVSLDDASAAAIQALAGGLSVDIANGPRGGDPLTLLKADKAALELLLIVLGTLSPLELAPLVNRAEYAAAVAAAWYSEHLAEVPSLAEVARAVACSESHFRRLFHQARGVSPMQAFERIRMERAQAMLLQRSGSIKEIAAACGYGSQSCFSRAYKRWSGQAPRESSRRIAD
jgi:AraC-like DNA-binding protein